MVYLSDSIGEEYKQWQPKDIVFLCGQTGAGKTTFVMDKLLKYVSEECPSSKILYVCNRKSLYKQVSEEIGCSIADRLILFTYQEIEENQGRFWAEIYSSLSKAYLIFDEIHYITQDALFNSGTHYWKKILTQELRFKNNCIMVFITATPDEVLPFLYSHIGDANILKREANSPEIQGFDKIRRENNRIFQQAIGKVRDHLDDWNRENSKIKFYPAINNGKFVSPDYSYMRPFLYDNNQELVDEIISKHECSDTKQEKWLIFVNKIAEGNDMKAKLSKLCPKLKTILLYSKLRNDQRSVTSEKEYIHKNQSLSCDVLITTSVLINGVSIKDSDVKNIVLPYTEKVELLQALGRIRIDPDYPTNYNVYLRSHGYGEIYEKKTAIKNDVLRLILSINTHNPVPVKLDQKKESKKFAISGLRYSYNDSNRTQIRNLQLDARMQHKIDKFLYSVPANESVETKDMNMCNVVIKSKKEVNTAALFHALYSYIQYEDVLLRYREKYLSDSDADSDAEPRETTDNRISPTEKRRFFFIEQLRWLGLSEDPEIIKRMGDGSISLSFKRKADELLQLKKKYENRPIEKIEQEGFRREMYEVLKYLSPDVFYADNFRYKKANEGSEDSFSPPGKKRLNKALMPYRLEVVSDYRKRKTTWLLRDIVDSEVERAE